MQTPLALRIRPTGPLAAFAAEDFCMQLADASHLRVEAFPGSRAVTGEDGEYAGQEPCTMFRFSGLFAGKWLVFYEVAWEPLVSVDFGPWRPAGLVSLALADCARQDAGQRG